MPGCVLGRNHPGVGEFSKPELHAISRKSCGVLRGMGPRIRCVQSCLTDDKVCCVQFASDEATLRRHAALGAFPANSVSPVHAVIDPTTSG